MTELPTINLTLFAQTDIGLARSGNEDNFLIIDLSTGRSWTAMEEEPSDLVTCEQGYYGTLLAVSDGMGGALAGEVASRMAVETVRDRMLQLQAHDFYSQLSFAERLRVAIEQANDLIHSESLSNPLHKGLGATFTAVATIEGNAYFGQVGDSRAYLIRRGAIHRITKDQSLVQQLIDAGQITEEEAETHSYRNVILQALGAHATVNVEINTLSLCQNDILAICSDGLSGKIYEDEIVRIIEDADTFQVACQQMIYLANSRGGEDNITVVIVQFAGGGLPPAEIVTPRALPRSPSTPTRIDWATKEAGEGDTSEYRTGRLPAGISGSDSSRPQNIVSAPPPPSRSQPFTNSPRTERRERPDRPRTNDLSDRREPITAVFGPDEIEGQTGSQSSSRATSKVFKHSGKPSAGHTNARLLADSLGSPFKAARSSRRHQYFIIGLVLTVLTVLLIGGASYIRRQATARQHEEIARARTILDNEKEGQIRKLREKMDELSKKIEVQSADKPVLKSTLDKWREQLESLGVRLDEISKLPSEPSDLINQRCEDIGNELRKIEDDLDKLQGLLPPGMGKRAPVRV
jgi:protein phosphatase